MPIITISRGTFSGGKGVAKRLADRLGCQCVSREIMLDAARNYLVPRDKLEAAMETLPSYWEHETLECTRYVSYLRAALAERALSDSLVYHGYAGHLLLAGIPHVIRVRIIADMDFRVKAAMQQLNQGRDAALSYIRKADKAREDWNRLMYGVSWTDPGLYDLVLNLSRISPGSACDMIAHMTVLREFRPTQESHKALGDLALASRIEAELKRNSRTARAKVQVTADDGHVTITGTAGSRKVVDTIPIIVGRLTGVKDVISTVGVGADWLW